MPTTRNGRLAAVVASAALAAGGLFLAAPVASAAPVFTDANTNLDPFSGARSSGGPCGTISTPGPNTTVPVVENGGTATATASESATYNNSGNTNDNATGTASDTASGSVASVGGTLKSLDFTSSGSYTLDQQLATSACGRQIYAGVDLDFDFTLTQAGYLHVKMSNSGASSYGGMYIYKVNPTGNSAYVVHYGQGLKFNGTDDVFLPAGEYSGYFQGEASTQGDMTTDSSGSATTSVHATFAVAGSQTVAQTGKGHRYVTFASARSCATHVLGASITSKKKLADQIKWVKFYVNNTKVKKLRTPDKGEAVNLPMADDQPADVMAKVKLFPKTEGKPGKLVQTSASYEACS